MSDKSVQTRISVELLEIFNKIRDNVSEYTWGADEDFSNFKCSKILARKVKQIGLY